MKGLSREEFLALFHKDVRDMILYLARDYKADYIVCYEVLDMSSSKFGDRKAAVVGPNNTIKDLEQAAATKLDMELASTIKWPVAYTHALGIP